jgi:hypothetical protein
MTARHRTRWLAGVALACALSLPAVAVAEGEEALETTAETGPVSATVRLTPAEPALGDVLELVLEVRAEPQVELLMPEFGDALDRFTIVDFAESDAADDAGGTLATQRYSLQPPHSGPQTIPPLLVEFIDRRPGHEPAPEGEDAYELLTEALSFDVSSALPEGAPLEFRDARGELGPLRGPGRGIWPWLAGAALALLAAAPFAARSFLAWRARARRRSAYEIARADLDALILAPRPREQEMDAFFVKLSGIIRHYLENRFGLRSPELTTEEFLEELARSPDLLRSQQRLLQEFLKRADLVKFAHHVPAPGDVEDSLDAARRFLDETRDLARVGGDGA